MQVFKAKTKKWGNSTGIIIPRELQIPPNKELTFRIDSPNNFTRVKDIFGLFQKEKITFKKSTQQIMKEIDRDLDSDF